MFKGKISGIGAGGTGVEGQLGGGGRKGLEKDKGSEALKEMCRKDSGSSVGSSVGSVKSGWGKKREKEEGVGSMEREGRGGFKKSGKRERSPVKGDKEGEEQGGGGLEVMMMELVREIRKVKVEMRKEREERRRVEEEWRGERRKWEEWMKEKKARRERIEEKLEKLEGRDRRMVEVEGEGRWTGKGRNGGGTGGGMETEVEKDGGKTG